MENRQIPQVEEEEIDLKELMLFILRKWRVLILAGVIGVALGIGVGLLMGEKTIDDLEMDDLHLKEIAQYARYQELYDEQMQKEQESVYMNMDPENVYTHSKIYFITAYESDITRINEWYNTIFRDSNIYDDLIAASGLDCTERAIRELAGIGFSRYEKEEREILFGKQERSAQVSISVVAPNEKACEGMMEYLDARVQAMNTELAEKFELFTVELIADNCQVGYNSGVVSARASSNATLASYTASMAELKKDVLTDDDLFYYGEVYVIDKEEYIWLGWLKWGILIGVLFGGVAVCVYGVQFFVCGYVMNLDEIKRYYGLRQIACLEAKKAESTKKPCIIDTILAQKHHYNTDAYAVSSLKAMELGTIQISGDMQDTDIAAKAALFEGAKGFIVSNAFDEDEQAILQAKGTDGAVLFVHLWKTKRKAMERELEICSRIGQKVLGVVVIA